MKNWPNRSAIEAATRNRRRILPGMRERTCFEPLSASSGVAFVHIADIAASSISIRSGNHSASILAFTDLTNQRLPHVLKDILRALAPADGVHKAFLRLEGLCMPVREKSVNIPRPAKPAMTSYSQHRHHYCLHYIMSFPRSYPFRSFGQS